MEYISRVHIVFVRGKFVEGLRYSCGELGDATNQYWDVRESCAQTSQVYNLLAKSFLDFLGWRGQWFFLYVFLCENIDISNIIIHYQYYIYRYMFTICIHVNLACGTLAGPVSWEVPGWHVETAFGICQRQVLHRLQAGAHIHKWYKYYWSFYRSKPYEIPLYDIVWYHYLGGINIHKSQPLW